MSLSSATFASSDRSASSHLASLSFDDSSSACHVDERHNNSRHNKSHNNNDRLELRLQLRVLLLERRDLTKHARVLEIRLS